MVDSAAVVFSRVVRRLLAVDSSVLDWKAPSRPRKLLMSAIDWSITPRAVWALVAESTLMVDRKFEPTWPIESVVTFWKATEAVWLALAPIWKVKPELASAETEPLMESMEPVAEALASDSETPLSSPFREMTFPTPVEVT